MTEDFLTWVVDTWPGRVIGAALITLAIWGMSSCYRAGVREMENEPAQAIVDKSHTTRSYSCGNNCVTSSDEWTLLAESSDYCNVGRREYARAKLGQEWKCSQLFGWRQY